MLSNTADTKPSPSVVRGEGLGKRSTGIIEAIKTSESRKIELLRVRGSTSQSGRRIPMEITIAVQTATPMNGKLPECFGNFVFTVMFAATATTRISATIPIRIQSM